MTPWLGESRFSIPGQLSSCERPTVIGPSRHWWETGWGPRACAGAAQGVWHQAGGGGGGDLTAFRCRLCFFPSRTSFQCWLCMFSFESHMKVFFDERERKLLSR